MIVFLHLLFRVSPLLSGLSPLSASDDGQRSITAPATMPVVGQGKRLSESIAELGVPMDSIYLDGFPDYSFYLRAKLTPQQWREIERQIEGHWTRREGDWPTWAWGGHLEPKPKWWTPTQSNKAGSYYISLDSVDAALNTKTASSSIGREGDDDC